MWLSTPAGFRPQHPWDRVSIPLLVALIWVSLVRGFAPVVARHFTEHEPPYVLLVHAHAAAFVGWVVLLSVQVALIETRRYALHRTLGPFGAGLAGLMVVLGVWVAIVDEQLHFGTADSDTAFLAIEFLEMVAFPAQVGAAIWLRADGAAHKRLILLATLFLTTAGFGRFAWEPLEHVFGRGFWPFMAAFYGPTDLLVLALGAYDWVTRRRLHPAYVAGVAVGVAAQLVSSALYYDPAWKALTLSIIGR